MKLHGRTRLAPLAITAAVLALGGAPAFAMPATFTHPDTTQTHYARPPLPKNMTPLPKAPAQSADLAKARKVAHVYMVVRHRVFANFVDMVKADLGAPFQVGDTEYTATILQYVPDFAMDIESGRVYSRTDQANNPAFRIAVKQKDTAVDTTWALLDMPPHFARRSLLSFQVTKIEYTSGKPILPRLATAPPAMSGMPPGPAAGRTAGGKGK